MREIDFCGVPLISPAIPLSPYAERLPAADPLDALARAIAASPGWPAGCQATLVIRRGPAPALAVVGRFEEARKPWLLGQVRALHDACRRLRYVEVRQVEEDCRALAGSLREALGAEDVAGAAFTAIPRGGLTVLDLLAGPLGLAPGQMRPPFPMDRPLVVVDDCALSGARFHRFLREIDHPRVVFAPLYSHPELRAAIRLREPHVAACLSARDLDGRRIEDSSAADAFYWSGESEALCFPWNEPDRLFRDPTSGRWELAWRIVPPELCAKNRPVPGTDPIPIQLQPEGRRPLRPSPRALAADVDGLVVVCDLATGETFSLAGSGSDLWRAIVRHGDLPAAVADLRREYAVPEETLLADARRFTQELCARGLLETSAPAALRLAS